MIKINLLREPSAPRKGARIGSKISGGLLYTLIIAAVAVAAVVWWYFSLTSTLADQRAELADLERESRSLAQVKANIERSEKVKAALDTRVALIERMQRDQRGPVLLMNAVLQCIPSEPKLWMTSMAQRARNVTLEGFAFDVPAIADFIASLSKTPPFASVELEYWEDQGGVIKYKLNCQLQD